MEEKRCGICTAVIRSYPCPLCGYAGELEKAPEKRAARIPEEELTIRQPAGKQAAGKQAAKKKKCRKKKKRSRLPVILLLIVLILLLGAIGVAYFTVHFWQPASCTSAQLCSLCGRSQGAPLGHSWVSRGCLTPGYCSVCGASQDAAPGHSWQRTDCLMAGTCSVCGAQEPEAPGHAWQAATCEAPMTCSRCGLTDGQPLGHIWDGVTQPAACVRCGMTLSTDQQAALLLPGRSQAVYDSLFAAPDWQALYRTAGIADTAFESAREYADFMSAQDLSSLDLQELTGAPSPVYAVNLGQTPIAEFTLVRSSPTTPDWQLGSLQLYLQRQVTVTVQAPEGSIVALNGVRLDDSYLTGRSASRASQYLPEGTPDPQLCTWQVTGLFCEPSVSVTDAAGSPVAVQQQGSGVYLAAGDGYETISDSQRAMVFAALEGYAGFMINASGARSAVTRYFENGTKTCQDILLMGSELWMNTDRGHSFREETILSYRQYSDTVFAVRASLIMQATLKDGGSRDYKVCETMIFRQLYGNWACYAMTNQDILTPETPKADTDEWADYPDGIRIEEYTGPNFNAHVMLIRDPSRVYLGLSSYTYFSESIPGKRLTVAIADENAVAAVNAGAFNDDGTANLNVGALPAGLTIYEGRVVSNQLKGLVPEKGFCGLTADNRLIVTETMTEADAAALNIRYGCEFGPVLIQDSQINQTAYNKTGYNPRTAVAQRADGTILFVCADGRQAGSLGATYADMIDLLLSYGAVNACNMDGGSSTVMLTRDPSSGTVTFVNSYSVLQSVPRRMPTFWMVR